MHPSLFTEPPSHDALAHARLHLEKTRLSLRELVSRIHSAEAALAQVVKDAKCEIAKLEDEKRLLEEDEVRAQAYLSPIRRLPAELLREIFLWRFEEHASCAWVLASVCSSWRRLALRTPRLWSKIRLVTTPTSSPELVRLWLERSGYTVPLDIEIYLRVADQPSNTADVQRRRRRRSSSSPSPSWLSFASHNGVTTHYVMPHNLHQPIFPPPPGPFIPPLSPSQESVSTISSMNDRLAQMNARPNIHWAHIAFYYLVEQMPRWERFIFRYDKAFKSITALASITGQSVFPHTLYLQAYRFVSTSGDAPLLKEFEVSSAESGCSGDWPWLPNTSDTSNTPSLPKLASLTLQQVPFKWSSPIFHMNLRALNLRAPLNPPLPLDRIRYIIAHNPALENLSLYFQGVLANVLPLSPLRLSHVTSLRLGGHYLLSQLLDSLTLPSLKSLTLLVDPREPVEDTITNLLTRSSMPVLEELSLGYETPAAAFMYYLPAAIVTSWRVLLEKLPGLRVLKVGGTPVEALLMALGSNEDDGNGVSGWVCPALETLAMRGYMLHSEAVTKLVQLVEARNPDGASGGSVGGPGPVGVSGGGGGSLGVKKLKCLEMQECELGMDVERWLGSRVENVVCVDPPSDRVMKRRRYF